MKDQSRLSAGSKAELIDKELTHLPYSPAVHLENGGGMHRDGG